MDDGAMEPPDADRDPDRDRDRERLRAAASFKQFLMTNSTGSNTNLYDHLTRLLMRVMDERPRNAVDVIEDLSVDVKLAAFRDERRSLRGVPAAAGTAAAELLAEQQRLLFVRREEPDQEEEELVETSLPDVGELAFHLEQAGVGLGREEALRVLLALKQLVDSQALPRCRLWGKVLGTEASYIVAEAEYREGETEEEQEEAEEAPGDQPTELEAPENQTDAPPQSTYKPPPVVPKEAIGTGANRSVYYVCREPGLAWIKLPAVTPAQIAAARQIRKFFTGRLDAPVVSYPPFPGNEANYLRAQIARISAGTQVSPQSFYQAGEEEGEEVEEAPQNRLELNPDFEGLPVAQMVESLSTWVHHVQHILPQGRCTWVNMAAKPEEDPKEEEDEEDEEDPEERGEEEREEKEADEPQPQVGPPLLTPLSQDAEMFNTPPWTSKMSSTLISQHAIAVLRSNLWPGANAYARGKKCENIYIGWGLKYCGRGYSPPAPPPPHSEYPSGPDVSEATDPTLEEEQALQEALEQQRAAEEEEKEAAEEEEEAAEEEQEAVDTEEEEEEEEVDDD